MSSPPMPRIALVTDSVLCCHTPQGVFCHDSHTVYIFADDRMYLGSVTIGRGLHTISRDAMVLRLKQIEPEHINSSFHELGTQLYKRINTICSDLQKQFPANTFGIERHSIKIQAIAAQFDMERDKESKVRNGPTR